MTDGVQAAVTGHWECDVVYTDGPLAGQSQRASIEFAPDGRFLQTRPAPGIGAWKVTDGLVSFSFFEVLHDEQGQRAALVSVTASGQVEAVSQTFSGTGRGDLIPLPGVQATNLTRLAARRATPATDTATGTASYFAYLLMPPRATFAQDIDARESEIMTGHVEYWHSLVDSGVAVVFGPVLERSSSWGLAIVRAESAARVHELAADDPAVASRLMTYEVLNMPGAIAQ